MATGIAGGCTYSSAGQCCSLVVTGSQARWGGLADGRAGCGEIAGPGWVIGLSYMVQGMEQEEEEEEVYA